MSSPLSSLAHPIPLFILQQGLDLFVCNSNLMCAQDDYDTPRIYHQGVGSAWLSKSPVDDLNNYHGDGDWFKIMSVLEPTEQSIDWSVPENKKWYNSLYSLWGTYMVDSVRPTYVNNSTNSRLTEDSGTLRFPSLPRLGNTCSGSSTSIRTRRFWARSFIQIVRTWRSSTTTPTWECRVR
jgi:hypothetical protein